jgi:hypothetical protein
MMHKPNPVTQMQDTARAAHQRNKNLRRYGTLYPPGELRRSLIVLVIMVVLGAVAVLVYR